MTGIGKIVSGSKKQISAKNKAGSRAAYTTGSLESVRLGQTMNDIYTSAALAGSIFSTYQGAQKPHDELRAGAKEVGLDMPAQDWKQRIGNMFSSGDDLSKTYDVEGSDNYQYREDDSLSVKQTHQYSGATLQDIGKRAKSGTLQSYLGEESIGDKFGKDVSQEKWWDAKMGQVDAHQPASQSTSNIDKQRTFQRGIGEGGGQGAYGNRGLVGGTDTKKFAQRQEGIAGIGEFDSKLGRKGMNIGPDEFELYRDPYAKGVYNRAYAPEAGVGPGQSDDYRAGTHAADPNYDQLGGGTSEMGGSFDDSARSKSPIGEVRYEHTEMPGYMGQNLRSGEVGDIENNAMQGYEPGYNVVPAQGETPIQDDSQMDYEKYMTDLTSDDPYRGKPSWLKPNSMYETYRDSTR